MDSYPAIVQFGRQLGTLKGVGQYRAVYKLNERFVIKVPINELGYHCNLREYLQYQYSKRWPDKFKNDIQYARCRMIRSSGFLVMEYVDTTYLFERPWWADFVDCAQVGKNRAGKIVAYDFG